MRMRIYVIGALLMGVVSGGSLRAQEQHTPDHHTPDPIQEHIFSPEFVIEHRREIELTGDQEELIKGELLQTQTRFTELQWQLKDEVEEMASLLDRTQVEEAQVLNQLDEILNVEREIKRTHFALVVRVKNALTSNQQAELREMMEKRHRDH